MLLLVYGFALFVAAHIVPASPAFRERLVGGIGMTAYKIVLSVLSVFALLMIGLGYARADYVHLWDPVASGRIAAAVAMAAAFVLLAAAYAPAGNIKRFVRHPMLLAVALWAAAHLLNRGDLASLVLFGGFGLYALFAIGSAERHGKVPPPDPRPLWRDGLAVAIGLAVFAGVAHLHEWLFGVAPFSV